MPCNIRIDHVLQRKARLCKGMPDDISAHAMIVIRITAGIITAFIARTALRIRTGPDHEIMNVIDPVRIDILCTDIIRPSKLFRCCLLYTSLDLQGFLHTHKTGTAVSAEHIRHPQPLSDALMC